MLFIALPASTCFEKLLGSLIICLFLFVVIIWLLRYSHFHLRNLRPKRKSSDMIVNALASTLWAHKELQENFIPSEFRLWGWLPTIRRMSAEFSENKEWMLPAIQVCINTNLLSRPRSSCPSRAWDILSDKDWRLSAWLFGKIFRYALLSALVLPWDWPSRIQAAPFLPKWHPKGHFGTLKNL